MIRILGIGETCGSESARELVPYLRHELPSVRRATLKAIGRLDHEETWKKLPPLVMDPSPSVSKLALKLIWNHNSDLPTTEFATALESDAPLHVKENILHLLHRRSRWRSLPTLLTFLKDAELGQTVERLLNAWLIDPRGRISVPKGETIDTAEDALRAAISESQLDHRDVAPVLRGIEGMIRRARETH